MKYAIIVAAILIFFAGCHSDLPIEVQKKPVSSWISNPPRSDSSTLYALGEGKDQYEALANGLSQIVSSLSVSVRSQYDATTKVKNVNGVELYTNDVEQKVSSSVKELRIPNYEIINYEEIGFNSYAVLLKVDKKLFFSSLKNEVDNTIKLLQVKEKAHSGSNLLQRYAFYKQTSKSVDDLTYKSIILKVLDPSFDNENIINVVAHFKESFTNLRSKISFSLEADQQSKNFLPVIKDELTAKGFQLSSKQDDQHLHVKVRSDTVYSMAYGFTIARCVITIDVRDSKEQILLSKKVDVTGQSTQGQEVAKQNVALKFKEHISDSDIL